VQIQISICEVSLCKTMHCCWQAFPKMIEEI